MYFSESDESEGEEEFLIVSDSEGSDSSPDGNTRSTISANDRHTAAIAAAFLNTSHNSSSGRLKSSRSATHNDADTTITYVFSAGARKNSLVSVAENVTNSRSAGGQLQNKKPCLIAPGTGSNSGVISGPHRADHNINSIVSDVIYDELSRGCMDGLNDTLLQRRHGDLTLTNNLVDAADVSLLSDISFSSDDLTVGLQWGTGEEEALDSVGLQSQETLDPDDAAAAADVAGHVIDMDTNDSTSLMPSNGDVPTARVCLNLQSIFGQSIESNDDCVSQNTDISTTKTTELPKHALTGKACIDDRRSGTDIDGFNPCISSASVDQLYIADDANARYLMPHYQPVHMMPQLLGISPGFTGDLSLQLPNTDNTTEVLCLPVRIDPSLIGYQPSCLPISLPSIDFCQSNAASTDQPMQDQLIESSGLLPLPDSQQVTLSLADSKVAPAFDSNSQFVAPYSLPLSVSTADVKSFYSLSSVVVNCSTVSACGQNEVKISSLSSYQQQSGQASSLWVTIPSWLCAVDSKVDVNSNEMLSRISTPVVGDHSKVDSLDVLSLMPPPDTLQVPVFATNQVSAARNRGQKRAAAEDSSLEMSFNSKRQRAEHHNDLTTANMNVLTSSNELTNNELTNNELTLLNSSMCGELVLKCNIDCLPVDGLNTTAISDLLGESTVSDHVTLAAHSERGRCSVCAAQMPKSLLAHCTVGHACCGNCLQGQVKQLLTDTTKVLSAAHHDT